VAAGCGFLPSSEGNAPNDSEYHLEDPAVFVSSRMPCAECGASVRRTAALSHTCEPRRRMEFQTLVERSDIRVLEDDFHAFLGSKEGQLELWLARRQLRRTF
jgi:hypothetical protein